VLATLRDTQADRRSLERLFGSRKIESLTTLGEPRLGALAGGLGPLQVNLLDALRRIGQHDDAVVQHLEEAAEDDQRLLAAALLDTHLTGREKREERRVLWQDAELPLRAGRDDHVDVLSREHDALAGDDLDVQL
jgi:hypothetical protein